MIVIIVGAVCFVVGVGVMAYFAHTKVGQKIVGFFDKKKKGAPSVGSTSTPAAPKPTPAKPAPKKKGASPKKSAGKKKAK